MTHTALDEFKSGWQILTASSVGIASGLSGLAFYTFGVFIVPLEQAFGWSRGDLSIASSFLIIGTAITAPIIGTIIDKYGARRVGLWSTLALSLGYLGLTQLQENIMAFYAAWLAIALIGGGTTPVVWTRAINIWFDRGRGLALGLTLGGSGLSGIFGPIFCTAMIAAYGWQGGYIGLGLIILLVALPVIYLLFQDHETNPHKPSGQAEQRKPASSLAGLSLHESVRSAPFWIIAGGFFVVSGTVAGLIINIVPMLIDRGLTAQRAAGIAGTLGIAVVIGRVGIGYLLDRFRAALIARILLTITAAGCFLLTLDGSEGVLISIAVMSLGFAAAAEVDLVAYLTSRYFGMKSYGKIYGWQTSAFYLGAAAGPILVGIAYNAFNSYSQVLYTSIILLLLGALVVGSLGKPPQFGDS
ncbi:MAG: MFS transporter [Rhodospirillaceae bacterium]